MGNLFNNQVSFLIVFLEGIFSFFSPCVIPLLPVYMGYLAGSMEKNDAGIISYKRKTVLFYTIFFILGISFAFLLLGTSFTFLGKIISGNKFLFVRISGILIIIFGLFQLEVFRLPFLQKERKIHFSPGMRNVNPLKAFVLGFTFSFAWTPCIGPALSSVLILVSGAKTEFTGYVLLLLYALGFILPFLILGLFTTQALNFFKKNQKIMRYTIKAGGILLVLVGVMTFTGFMNGISGYLNSGLNQSANVNKPSKQESVKVSDTQSQTSSENETSSSTISEEDFKLEDQYGEKLTLSDYKGKVVFLNFFATWCPPCNKELPDIEKLYSDYGDNKKDVIFIGVTNPKSDAYPNNSDENTDYIKNFLTEKKYTFPVVFDTTGEVLQAYGISAFPTTYIIDKKGNILGYVPGMMTEDIMKKAIKQALEEK